MYRSRWYHFKDPLIKWTIWQFSAGAGWGSEGNFSWVRMFDKFQPGRYGLTHTCWAVARLKVALAQFQEPIAPALFGLRGRGEGGGGRGWYRKCRCWLWTFKTVFFFLLKQTPPHFPTFPWHLLVRSIWRFHGILTGMFFEIMIFSHFLKSELSCFIGNFHIFRSFVFIEWCLSVFDQFWRFFEVPIFWNPINAKTPFNFKMILK